MQVWYMNGAGNDFMVIDARGQKLDFSSLAKKLCRLTNADGFMAVDNSEIADFRLHFYNSDGSRGEMCGNGARCICRFAWELGIVGTEMSVQTDAGIVLGKRVSANRYLVKLNNPSVLDLHRTPNAAYVELGEPGVPHAITELNDLDWAKDALKPTARALRHNNAFPKGANANLYRWLDEGSIRILTYERGVEDYTLACGTGSAATAALLFTQGKLPSGVLKVENPGGTLTVTVTGTPDQIEAIWLEGPATICSIVNV